MSMDKKEILLPLFALISAFIFVFFIIPLGFGNIAAFDFDMKGEEYMGMFTHLIIVALIVERFIEVYNSIWRKPGRIRLEAKISTEQDTTKKLKLEADLKNYRAHTGILAMYGGFAAGILVALAGVNTLGILFDASELSPVQLRLFNSVDIVISAGLIAGGSKGLNDLTSLIGTILQTSKDKVKANP
ncbi:MAG: hypothetical protein AMJ53_05160 [Gammaproteobacteria bacterium SG8_11]|nr:MAG: hypothetical protein AMJ53_05160 [Gammaproteobacteria bacterium SG8_11]